MGFIPQSSQPTIPLEIQTEISFLQMSWEERGFTDIWVIQKLFSSHFLFDHRAVVDAEKLKYLKWDSASSFCRLLGRQLI